MTWSPARLLLKYRGVPLHDEANPLDHHLPDGFCADLFDPT
jgi:hypothetical protein